MLHHRFNGLARFGKGRRKREERKRSSKKGRQNMTEERGEEGRKEIERKKGRKNRRKRVDLIISKETRRGRNKRKEERITVKDRNKAGCKQREQAHCQRGLGRVTPSIAGTLGSWLQIPFRAWICVRDFLFVCAVLCNWRPCEGMIPCPRSSAKLLKDSYIQELVLN
jgi:hypothetical protein